MARKILAFSAVLVCFFSNQISHANMGEMYGFGARTASMAGADVAGGFDGYAAYNNPAALARPQSKRLVLSYSWQLMEPSFTGINNVITENNFTSDKSTTSNVDTSYRTTFGQAIGISYRLFPEFHDFTLGAVLFFPILQTAYMDSGETYEPEYVLYRSRTQRPQIELGIGGSLGKGFHLGLGAHLAYSLTSNASVFLQTDPTKTSTMRFSSSLKPKIAPYLGFLYVQPEKENYSGGLVFRAPITSPSNMVLASGARVLGSFAALDFNFAANSALYYDPMSLELGGMVRTSDRDRTFVQLDYQWWGLFKAPFLVIQNPSVNNCADNPGSTFCNPPGVKISPTIPPSLNARNILTPRIAEEISFERTVLRFGYAYHQSIFKDVPDNAGNLLDPAKHMLNVGVGFQFKKFLSFETPTNVDVNFAYHQLVAQNIVKSPGDETGAAGQQKIGAPGYTAGGKILGGGVSLTLAF